MYNICQYGAAINLPIKFKETETYKLMISLLDNNKLYYPLYAIHYDRRDIIENL